MSLRSLRFPLIVLALALGVLVAVTVPVERILGGTFLAASAFGLVMACLLALGRLAPGPRLGYSAAGQGLIALGALGMGARDLDLLQGVTGASWAGNGLTLCLAVGLLVEHRARRRWEERGCPVA